MIKTLYEAEETYKLLWETFIFDKYYKRTEWLEVSKIYLQILNDHFCPFVAECKNNPIEEINIIEIVDGFGAWLIYQDNYHFSNYIEDIGKIIVIKGVIL